MWELSFRLQRARAMWPVLTLKGFTRSFFPFN
jgi:hypothetical protein